jgi:hypothetical protein
LTDHGDRLEGKAHSHASPVDLLATREGLHRGVCFDESEMVYIRRVFEQDSCRAQETASRARRLAAFLSKDNPTLAGELGRSRRTVERHRANLLALLETRLRSLRESYRSAGKDADASAVTDLIRKLERVSTLRVGHQVALGR